jgi:hypothetical protein
VDYFQGVVIEYLRANRATFVNTECCIQLHDNENPDVSGPHWFCDALAVNLLESRAYLCEVSYAKSLGALRKRLASWREHWPLVRVALKRDCGISLDWTVTPWAFVPKDISPMLAQYLSASPADEGRNTYQMPRAKITFLEDVVPWKYRSWDRKPDPDDSEPQSSTMDI